jgi:hypothetical protein
MLREVLNGVLRATALAGSVLAIALLAGCGGDDDDAPDSTVAGAESVPTGTQQSGGGGGSAEDSGGGSAEDSGEEAEGADRDAAASAVQGFLRAWAGGDWARACSLMATSTKENVELFASQYVKSQSCAEQVEALGERLPAKMLPQGERIQVTAVRIEEERGFVLYSDARGTEFAFPVLQEGSAWKVAAIVGSKVP